jgi:hypothetical protein
MTNLREVTRDPFFLESAGFTRREEQTTDFVRWVWFEKTIDLVEISLILQVEFELAISDDPSVPTNDNFSYGFNGVYLKILERSVEADRSCEKAEFLKHPRILPLNEFCDLFVKEEPREIDRFELRAI